MESSDYDMSVPKTAEELIHIQQRLESEIDALANEYHSLLHLTDKTETLCDINDAAWVTEEKEKLIDNLNQLKIPTSEIPPSKPEQFLITLQRLKNQLLLQLEARDVLQSQIDEIENKIVNDQSILLVAKENVTAMEEEVTVEDHEEEWDAQTKKDFQVYRKKLHLILERFFDKGSLKKLVQDLTTAYFSEKDEGYIDVNKGYSFGDIEVLKQACLIITHPDDKTKIKFCDNI